jgi:hypothetical protein
MSLTKFGEKIELRSEVEIGSEIGRVWSVLLDLPRHEQWNPFWTRLRGTLELAARITYDLTPPGGSSLRVRRVVETLDAPNELRWSGGYGWGWLLRSEQFVRLLAIDGSRTRLVIGENLRGPGVTGNSNTTLGIGRGQALMNQALKRFLESADR